MAAIGDRRPNSRASTTSGITGKAEKPSYLWIKDGRVEIRSAEHLWGKDTFETRTLIQQELGDPEIKVVCIGPARERLVRFASIITEVAASATRTGTGAVMGSKNLKAIAVRGSGQVGVAKPQELLHYSVAVNWKSANTRPVKSFPTGEWCASSP